VEQAANTFQIALCIFEQLEGMESTAETDFHVAQENVHPAKLREISWMATTGFNNTAAAACGN
jgi:hypothetical protein